MALSYALPKVSEIRVTGSRIYCLQFTTQQPLRPPGFQAYTEQLAQSTGKSHIVLLERLEKWPKVEEFCRLYHGKQFTRCVTGSSLPVAFSGSNSQGCITGEALPWNTRGQEVENPRTGGKGTTKWLSKSNGPPWTTYERTWCRKALYHLAYRPTKSSYEGPCPCEYR